MSLLFRINAALGAVFLIAALLAGYICWAMLEANAQREVLAEAGLMMDSAAAVRAYTATENARLVQAFGINVPLIVMGTYGAGVALAALAGVLAAPVVQVSPLMGSSLVIVVFAVVVIGGMGSIIGAILSGLVLGLIEGFTKVIYPEASNIVVFVIMAVVLIWRPAGLFGKE